MTCKPILSLIIISALSFGAQAAQIEIAELSETVKVLASEEFEGRKPGGPGEEKTVAYLLERLPDILPFSTVYFLLKHCF